MPDKYVISHSHLKLRYNYDTKRLREQTTINFVAPTENKD
jgi:hypothetical protein